MCVRARMASLAATVSGQGGHGQLGNVPAAWCAVNWAQLGQARRGESDGLISCQLLFVGSSWASVAFRVGWVSPARTMGGGVCLRIEGRRGQTGAE